MGTAKYITIFLWDNETKIYNGETVRIKQGETIPENGTDKIPTHVVNKMVGEEWVEDAKSEELFLNKSNEEFEKYLKRQKDGVVEYMKISGEFRAAKLLGQITEEAHSAIEAELKPVRDEITLGQWKEGLILLEGIGSSVIGQDLYDRLHAQITDYINKNYN